MSTVWEPRPDAGGAEGEGNNFRGDVLIRGLALGPTVIDLSITSASATTIMAKLHTDTTTGAAAGERYTSKIKNYTARFNFPRGRLWPIIMETGGRMHPDSRAHLSELAKGSLGLGPDYRSARLSIATGRCLSI